MKGTKRVMSSRALSETTRFSELIQKIAASESDWMEAPSVLPYLCTMDVRTWRVIWDWDILMKGMMLSMMSYLDEERSISELMIVSMDFKAWTLVDSFSSFSIRVFSMTNFDFATLEWSWEMKSPAQSMEDFLTSCSMSFWDSLDWSFSKTELIWSFEAPSFKTGTSTERVVRPSEMIMKWSQEIAVITIWIKSAIKGLKFEAFPRGIRF